MKSMQLCNIRNKPETELEKDDKHENTQIVNSEYEQRWPVLTLGSQKVILY